MKSLERYGIVSVQRCMEARHMATSKIIGAVFLCVILVKFLTPRDTDFVLLFIEISLTRAPVAGGAIP